jgi:spermidine synthase
MASSPSPRRVLVCGGGDGLAVREVLRHPEVERVVLVDLDPAMTDLARDHEFVSALNGRALHDPRVTVVNDDAMAWLEAKAGLFDVVVLDFPDPASFAVGKLYTTRFYERLLGVLAPDGVVACQATSILDTRKAFWCIARTMETVGLTVRAYRAYVPSFHGDWGFLLASRRVLPVPDRVPAGLRSLDPTTMKGLFDLPPDLGPVDVEPNRLDIRINYTIIGDMVNVGQRIEQIGKVLAKAETVAILLSESTRADLGPDFAPRSLGRHKLKGRVGDMEIFAL